MLYVYAITESAARPRGLGLRSAPLTVIGDEAPFAVASDHDRSIEPGEDDLWGHERVVEELMKKGPVLPLRFGTKVADEARLATVLEERRDEFKAALRRVRGAVELGVRARVRANPSRVPASAAAQGAPAGPGTGYMLGRLESERQLADVAARIHGPLAALARRSTHRPAGATAGAFKAAYLVDRERVERFRGRVEELTQEIEGATLTCTGPWPPYSFTDVTEG